MSKNSWEVAIKFDLQFTGCEIVDWIKMIQGRQNPVGRGEVCSRLYIFQGH
jgi:hypothetical protein